MPVDSALTWIGTLLEIVLLWRLISWKAWRPYPYFFAFFAWIFARLILIDIQLLAEPLSENTYGYLFWLSATLTVALRFLVFWEVYRNALPRRTAPHRLATFLLAGTLAALAIFLNLAASRGEFFSRVIANLAFAIAVCLLVVLGLIRYYRVNPGLNIWGMAIGTGILCAVDVLNFSAFDLDHGFFSLMRYSRPTSFLAQMAVWLFTLWHFAPPALSQGPPPGPGASGRCELPPLSDAAASARRAVGLKDPHTDEGDNPSK